MAELVLVLEGVRDLGAGLNKTDDQIQLALQRALNKTATRTRTRLARMVRDQVNLPASYVGPSSGRLTVTEKASRDNLAFRITGRDRPTSLARFVKNVGRRKSSRAGVRVQVDAKGPAVFKSSAFLIDLKNGNRGLAVRTKKGTPPKGAYRPKQMAPGLWLLYGPSVDQILQGVRARNGGAFGEVEDWSLEELEKEFFRLMKVDFD